jgi:acetyltransferase
VWDRCRSSSAQPEALARARPLRGDRFAVLTNGKALGALATGTFAVGEGNLAALADETKRALQAFVPSEMPTNPVDLPRDAPAELYAGTLQILAADPQVDGLLLVHAPSVIVPSEEIAHACVPVVRATERTVLSYWLGGQTVEGAHRVLSEAGLPTYQTPEQAARALLHLVAYRNNQEVLRQTPPSLPEGFAPDVDAARGFVANALSEERDRLTELEARSLLHAYQIPIVQTDFAESAGDAVLIADQFGYPVALKVVSPDITHRSEVAGVMVNLEDAEEVRLAARDIAKRLETFRPGARLTGYSVQKMIRGRGTDSPRTGAIEVALGVTVDAVFGPAIRG